MTLMSSSGETMPLTGLGVNVHLAIPGHQVRRPHGGVAWLAHDGMVIEDHGDWFHVIDPDLREPVLVPRTEIAAAAAQVANLIAARRHDAHRALRVIDDAIHGTEAQPLGATIANTLLDGRGNQ